MIFLDLYTLPNSTRPDTIFTQTATQVESFIPMLLLFVFFFVFLGGVVRQKLKLGNAEYSTWAVVASLCTLMVTLLMSVIEGLIQLDWLVVVVTVTIFCGIWFIFDKKSDTF